jgi:hypothetical protein
MAALYALYVVDIVDIVDIDAIWTFWTFWMFCLDHTSHFRLHTRAWDVLLLIIDHIWHVLDVKHKYLHVTPQAWIFLA